MSNLPKLQQILNRHKISRPIRNEPQRKVNWMLWEGENDEPQWVNQVYTYAQGRWRLGIVKENGFV